MEAMPVTARRQTGQTGTSVIARSRKPRPGRELLVELLFRPVAHLVVLALLPLRVPPPAVVLANAATGLLAAVAIGRAGLVAGALLLQLKTVLDNADGQLARAASRTTAVGRYLDTVCDFVVNAAVFVALGVVTGQWWLACVSFAALTLVLSVDFNLEALHRQVRGESFAPYSADRAGGGTALAVLQGVYGIVFAPQDRLVHRVSESRFSRLGGEAADSTRRQRAALAYYDDVTANVLANLGLSTQLAVLGVCLLAGAPGMYLYVPLGCLALVPFLQIRRERKAREALEAS
jgi:phosphatidylglycerophosphate synthase